MRPQLLCSGKGDPLWEKAGCTRLGFGQEEENLPSCLRAQVVGRVLIYSSDNRFGLLLQAADQAPEKHLKYVTLLVALL